MHGRRFDRILTGTAIALILGLGSVNPTLAQTTPDQAAIEAKVPLPEAANMPPPTAADVGPWITGTTNAVNLPEPPDLPPTSKDAAPAAAPTTAAPTVAPAPAPVVANADQPVMDALHDLISTRLSRVIERKAERTAVEAFYSSHDYAPIWFSINGPTERANQAMAHLRNADADGMDPADYPLPNVAAAATPAALAEAEMRLTDSVLDYTRQAALGRVHYSRVSGDIFYEQVAPQPLDVLSKLASGRNAEEVLDSYQPQHAAYKALRKKLAEIRGKGGNDAPAQIARGPVLEIATDKQSKQTVLMQDERVPALRAKLGLAAVADDTFYDKPLADAIAVFQKDKGLKATGQLTNATVDALNGKRHERDDQLIIANMERWRWVPRDLGKAHVVLNIPDYTLQVYNHGAAIWKTRVVGRKPGTHATPLLSETMKYITVNPTWNVPPSIVYNEYLPALQQDPTVLDRMGLRLEHNRDGSIHISQPPGEANALGRIRFNFPNKFLVYQHDTPDKNLFAKDERAFSHGCMRVQYPDQYAAALLNITMPEQQRYSAEKIRSMYGQSEIDLKFPTPIPVNITYQTAFVDDAGKLQIRKDVYGRDATMLSLLKGTRSKDLENMVAHSQPSYSRPPGSSLPAGVSFASDTSSSGPSFFERLFGGPSTTPPAPIGRKPQQQRPQRVITR